LHSKNNIICEKAIKGLGYCFGIGDIEKEQAKKNWEGMVSRKGD
jgi:hypothetical protein